MPMWMKPGRPASCANCPPAPMERPILRGAPWSISSCRRRVCHRPRSDGHAVPQQFHQQIRQRAGQAQGGSRLRGTDLLYQYRRTGHSTCRISMRVRRRFSISGSGSTIQLSRRSSCSIRSRDQSCSGLRELNYFQNRDAGVFDASFGAAPFAAFGGSNTLTRSYAGFVDMTYELTEKPLPDCGCPLQS